MKHQKLGLLSSQRSVRRKRSPNFEGFIGDFNICICPKIQSKQRTDQVIFKRKNALLRKLYQRCHAGIGDKSEQEFPVGHHTLGANGLPELDRQAELDSHSGILEIGRDVLTHDAHIVGIVHMMVIVDIVSGDLIRLVRREFTFGDVYAAVQVFHVELLFERHRVHDILRNPRQLARLPVDKRPHAPRLVARFALCIVNKRIAKSEHRFHAIDGGHHL